MLDGEFGHAGSFHIDGGGPGGVQGLLFGGCGSDVIDGGEDARFMSRSGGRKGSTEAAVTGLNFGGHKDIADGERRVERAAEARADNCVRLTIFTSNGGGAGSVVAAGAIGDHPQLAAGARSGTGPMEGPAGSVDLRTEFEQTGKFAAFRGD